MRPRLLTLAPLLAALLIPGAVRAAEESSVPDQGTFVIYVNDKPIGTENFTYLVAADSMMLKSDVLLLLPRGEAEPDTFTKNVNLIVKRADYDPHDYQSVLEVSGHKIVRGLSFLDTTFTAGREVDDRGAAEIMVRPPGRIYVIDPQVYSLFDLICRTMHGRTFDSREINILVLGTRDTVTTGNVEDLGTEVVRWGERPVTARKLAISDAQARFVMWVSPIGRMLRLEAPDAGLRVERQTAVKPPSSRDD